MKVNDLLKDCDFIPLAVEDEDRALSGVYVGDLLSRAMSHIEKDNVWVTIMTNKNVIAVAGLTEASCVILAEGTDLADDALEAARKNHVNIVKTSLGAYDACLKLARAFKDL